MNAVACTHLDQIQITQLHAESCCFVDHRLVVRTAGGTTESFALEDGLSVAVFDEQLHRTLRKLGVDVAIRETPFGVPMTTPFPADREHAAYDREAVELFWHILDWT